MDRQLLEALNNLSFAIERMAQILEESENSRQSSASGVAGALSSDRISQSLRFLTTGVRKLMDDNQRILRNQETIIQLSRSRRPDRDPFQFGSDSRMQKSRIRDGLGIILMIAAGILAVGLAFKILGKVDFVTVLTMAIALPLLAISFKKVAETPGLSGPKILLSLGAILAMALAITLSSYILQKVIPISPLKLLTAILIAGVFTVISFGIKQMAQGLSGFKPLAFVAAPFVLYTLSLAIALSSEVLQKVVPISFTQALTAIFIAGVFTVLSFGLGALAKGLRGIGPKDIVTLPLVMITLMLAIVGSSFILQDVQVLGIKEALTTILIAGVFTVLSYGLEKMGKGLARTKYVDIAKAPLIFFALSLAIRAASEILQYVIPLDFYKGLTAITIAGIFVILSYAIGPLMTGLRNVTYLQILKATITILAFTAAIVAASHIMTGVAPLTFDQGMAVIGSAIAISLSILAIVGTIYILNQLGSVAQYKKGIVTLLILAGVIAGASLIFEMGRYEIYPAIDWVLATAASILVFGILSAAIGALVELGGQFMLLGAIGIVAIAAVILATDKILGMGTYTSGPSFDWVVGTLASIAAFAAVAAIFGAALVATGGVGGLAAALGAAVIVGSAYVISQVDSIFSGGSFTKFPSMDWVSGTAKALTVYTLLATGSLFTGLFSFLGGFSLSSVANQIVEIDKEFSKGNFQNYPSKEWADGMAYSITTIANLNQMLSSQFGGGLFGVASSFMGFSIMANQMEIMAQGVDRLSESINRLDASKLMGLKNLTGAVVLLSLMDPGQYNSMISAIESKSGVFIDLLNKLGGAGAGLQMQGGGLLPSLLGGGVPAGAKPQKTLEDVIEVLNSINGNMTNLNTSVGKLTKFADEQRGGSGLFNFLTTTQ